MRRKRTYVFKCILCTFFVQVLCITGEEMRKNFPQQNWKANDLFSSATLSQKVPLDLYNLTHTSYAIYMCLTTYVRFYVSVMDLSYHFPLQFAAPSFSMYVWVVELCLPNKNGSF